MFCLWTTWTRQPPLSFKNEAGKRPASFVSEERLTRPTSIPQSSVSKTTKTTKKSKNPRKQQKTIEVIQTTNVHISRVPTLTMKLHIDTDHGPKPATALVDSGSTENLINQHLATELNLPVNELPEPVCLYQATGTEPTQTVTQYTNIHVTNDNKELKLKLLIVKELNQQVILGMPFLAEQNPKICWTTRTLKLVNRAERCASLTQLEPESPRN